MRLDEFASRPGGGDNGGLAPCRVTNDAEVGMKGTSGRTGSSKRRQAHRLCCDEGWLTGACVRHTSLCFPCVRVDGGLQAAGDQHAACCSSMSATELGCTDHDITGCSRGGVQRGAVPIVQPWPGPWHTGSQGVFVGYVLDSLVRRAGNGRSGRNKGKAAAVRSKLRHNKTIP